MSQCQAYGKKIHMEFKNIDECSSMHFYVPSVNAKRKINFPRTERQINPAKRKQNKKSINYWRHSNVIFAIQSENFLFVTCVASPRRHLIRG